MVFCMYSYEFVSWQKDMACFNKDSAEQIAWLRNFLDRCASLRPFYCNRLNRSGNGGFLPGSSTWSYLFFQLFDWSFMGVEPKIGGKPPKMDGL